MKKKAVSMMLAAVCALSLCACGSKSAEPAAQAEPAAEAPAETEAAEEESVSGTEEAPAGEEKVLKVAMECGYAPYNWTQPDDSNGAVPIQDSADYAYGYDVMMAKHIAEQLGYELQIVKLDWDSLVPAVQSGTVDCVIAGQSITSERLEMVDFSEPYYYASIVGLVKSDGKYADAAGLSDLAGATCTSQLGTIWYDVCLPQIKDAEIQPAQESAPAMLVALESGRTDLIVTDMPTAMAACVAYPDMKLLDFTGTGDDFEVSEEEINIGISVQKGNKELLDGINSVLAGMTTDDYEKMMNEAISVQPLSE
ncbi:MAG: transporter substrate-binding domain-containing protein [Lachnospiraceae bacterium]|nr:transporter substrate-binding domain-containing protein [Lachnospiraceae bacterium]MDD7147681.1 transporter substrate-binding domain-containing protein [Lachnospiraceae bacterium]MDY4068883.1 transporter substrate-binding domain-containing protein [Lachnospiraceae bacterium]